MVRSSGFTEAARTLTRTWLSAGVGFSTSTSVRTSGPPYSQWVMAFIGFAGAPVLRSHSFVDVQYAMNNQTTSARRITLADHFNTRFTFTELFHSDCDFTSSVSFFQISHRLRGLAQLVSPVDDGCHLPRLHEVAQQLQILFVQFRNIPDELLTDEPRQQIRFEKSQPHVPTFPGEVMLLRFRQGRRRHSDLTRRRSEKEWLLTLSRITS